jgi:DNA-binding beta-propeller fold protein YncE
MPYTAERGWHKPASTPGYMRGGNSGIAMDGARIFIAQRGEAALPSPVPAAYAGFSGSIGVNVLSGPRVWKNCFYVLDANGRVTEQWSQWDALCDSGAGPGLHRIRISPYDPARRLWIVNETLHQIYVLSNDGKTLLHTLGERGVPGSDATHFGRPQDVSFMPDGRILVADGLDNGRVMILDKDLRNIGEFGSRGSGPGQFNGIHTVAPGPGGRVYAFDRSGGRIHVYRTTSDPARFELIDTWTGFQLPLDVIVGEDALWMTDLGPLRFTKIDFSGRHLFTWIVSNQLPDGHLEVHAFEVDASGNLYTCDNQWGRTQKFIPKPGVPKEQLVGPRWVGR